MPDLELTRSPDHRKVYVLEGVGTLTLRGMFSRNASAEAGARSWELAQRGAFTRVIEAHDAAGTPVGEFRGRGIRRGGPLTWQGKDYPLRSASAWRERYALADGDRELAIFDGKGWGKRPVKVTIPDTGALDAGLVLFAAYVVRSLAEAAAATAASTSGGAT